MDALTIRSDRGDRDTGAALILALVFVVAIGVLFIALGGSASTDILNSNNLTSQRGAEYAATSAANMAVQEARYSGNIYSTSANCMPNGTSTSTVSINGFDVFADCVKQTWDPVSGVTRVINVYACLSTSTISPGDSTCTATNSTVTAQVTFDDYSVDNKYHCTAGGDVSTCGSSEVINEWIVETGNH